MHKGSKLISAVALTLFCAQPLWAQTSPRQSPAAPRPAVAAARRVITVLQNAGPSPFMMLLRSANLTPAQKTQVRQILRAHSMKNRPLLQQLHATEEQIAGKLLGTGAVSASDLAPLEQQASQIKTQMDQNMIDTSLAIRGVLTADQMSHLAEVHQRLEKLRTQIEDLLGRSPGGAVALPPN